MTLAARRAQSTTHLNLNSGLFYIQASPRTVAFMGRIAARLAREKAWDQVHSPVQHWVCDQFLLPGDVWGARSDRLLGRGEGGTSTPTRRVMTCSGRS